MEADPELMRLAVEKSQGHSYVVSESPEIPNLTGDPLVDAANQWSLSDEDLERISTTYGLEVQQACKLLVDIADILGGGLGPEGKQKWLIWKIEEGHTLGQILDDSLKYLESIAT